MKYKFLIYPISAILILGVYWVGIHKQTEKAELLGGKTIATSTIDNYINSLTVDQANWLASHPKYFSIDWTDMPQYELKYKIDEYEAPNGLGYLITVVRNNGYSKVFAIGPDALTQGYDWTLATSTP